MFLLCMDLEYGVSVFYSVLKCKIHTIIDKICNACVNVYRYLGFSPTLVILLITHTCTTLLCLLYKTLLYILLCEKYNTSISIFNCLY